MLHSRDEQLSILGFRFQREDCDLVWLTVWSEARRGSMLHDADVISKLPELTKNIRVLRGNIGKCDEVVYWAEKDKRLPTVGMS